MSTVKQGNNYSGVFCIIFVTSPHTCNRLEEKAKTMFHVGSLPAELTQTRGPALPRDPQKNSRWAWVPSSLWLPWPSATPGEACTRSGPCPNRTPSPALPFVRVSFPFPEAQLTSLSWDSPTAPSWVQSLAQKPVSQDAWQTRAQSERHGGKMTCSVLNMWNLKATVKQPAETPRRVPRGQGQAIGLRVTSPEGAIEATKTRACKSSPNKRGKGDGAPQSLLGSIRHQVAAQGTDKKSSEEQKENHDTTSRTLRKKENWKE